MEGKENKNKITAVALALATFAAAGLAVPLKSSTLEPSTMFLLGFGLIGLRIFISHRLNKMKRLPARTP
jgi:hypothetical protein